MLAEVSEISSDKRRKLKQKNSEDKARLYEEIGRLKVKDKGSPMGISGGNPAAQLKLPLILHSSR